MSQNHDRAGKGKWKQLNEKERYQIEGLLKAKKGSGEMAKRLGCRTRSIQRVTAMGMVRKMT